MQVNIKYQMTNLNRIKIIKTNAKILTAIVLALNLTACGALNSTIANRSETVEIYHIFDIKSDVSANSVIKAAADGLAMNSNSIVQNRPLQMGAKVPEKPGRFTLIDPAAAFKGTAMGNILAMGGGAGTSTMRVANCDGAVWSSKAVRDIPGSSNLTLFSCIYSYKSGYQLDVYAVFMKQSGGIKGVMAEAAYAVVGTPEQWVTKTIIDTVRSIELVTKKSVVHLEGQPELGELPNVDKLVK